MSNSVCLRITQMKSSLKVVVKRFFVLFLSSSLMLRLDYIICKICCGQKGDMNVFDPMNVKKLTLRDVTSKGM